MYCRIKQFLKKFYLIKTYFDFKVENFFTELFGGVDPRSANNFWWDPDTIENVYRGPETTHLSTRH